MIATDLDGTLLMTGSKSVHPEVKEAISEAIDVGIPVVFATGRSPIDIVAIAEMVNHHWYAVCNDGGTLVDLEAKVVEKTHPISALTLHQTVSVIRNQYPDAKFMIDRVAEGPINTKDHGLIFEKGFEAPWAWALSGASEVADIETVLEEENIVKLCVFIDQAESFENFVAFKELVMPFVHPIRVHSEKFFVDMARTGVNKSSGVGELAARHGVSPENVFAVGDLHNDYELLDWAGFSFAVQNAHPNLHDIVDIIVPTNDEGGVASVIRAAIEHARGGT
jgi:Cof subfamily protein (haloacid dehalogenase superfamily)